MEKVGVIAAGDGPVDLYRQDDMFILKATETDPELRYLKGEDKVLIGGRESVGFSKVENKNEGERRVYEPSSGALKLSVRTKERIKDLIEYGIDEDCWPELQGIRTD